MAASGKSQHLGELTAAPLAPGLYLVATPIGHASDISLRALAVLAGADLIAAEDTRVTAKLLSIHGITNSLTPYNDHNAVRMRPELLAKLRAGARIALVSDAGTPLVSDPGFKLVRAAIEEGLPVHAIPGASAVLTALLLSGLPSDRFLFAGFLPAKAGERQHMLEDRRPNRNSAENPDSKTPAAGTSWAPGSPHEIRPAPLPAPPVPAPTCHREESGKSRPPR